ncbi:type II toxin-antitoxin system YafQ family toxin [Helcococcus kunzii]|uniref:type II toxin-antitoxin system RelE/ParE family toxin n=1 Tax=Helcococcus kunzii TaxID=40091 RepID=UPI0024AD3CDC|nr:type II toxin-antitoxin system mRNA interferase toxin, RelE/StbE family [Helcococcus kunzii]
MKYNITYSKTFKKNYKKLTFTQKKLLKNKLKLFIVNPLHPSLRTKKIKGSDGIWEFSVNMDIRVIWYYEENNLIFFLDIGHHNILNKY